MASQERIAILRIRKFAENSLNMERGNHVAVSGVRNATFSTPRCASIPSEKGSAKTKDAVIATSREHVDPCQIQAQMITICGHPQLQTK